MRARCPQSVQGSPYAVRPVLQAAARRAGQGRRRRRSVRRAERGNPGRGRARPQDATSQGRSGSTLGHGSRAHHVRLGDPDARRARDCRSVSGHRRTWGTGFRTIAVGTGLSSGVRPAPRADPSERNYRTGLLPRVLASKRSSGQGCRMRTGGIHRWASRRIRCQLVRSRWLRRRSARCQCRVTWSRNRSSDGPLVGTA